jgi:hypothetical protein
VNEVIKGANYGWPFREGDRELGAWNFDGTQVMGRPGNLIGTLTEPNLFYERPAAGASLRIQYGGSVKPDNVGALMAVPDVDGALVGGAALRPDTFLPIVRFA